MSQPIDACPTCGKSSLVAVCKATVEYTIANESGGQSWDRGEVDDDDSTATSFRCGGCGAEFPEFGLDANGFLVRLGHPVAKGTPPEGAMTSEQFQEWLTGRVDAWCDVNGLTPHGEGEDLGDLYRELDEADALAAIGVTLVPAYETQTLYIIGPNASWLATTGVEMGAESETVWQDPLTNLRLDVPMAELVSYRDQLRRTVGEIASLLGHAQGGRT